VSAATVRLFTDPACPPLPSEHAVSELRMAVVRERRLAPWPHAPGSDATIHACRAVVAAGLRWPDRQLPLLAALQALSAAGEPLDDSDTLELAAARAGIPVAEIAAYCAEPEVEAALRADMAACRGREIPSLELVGLAPLTVRRAPG
jgi:predicted DsbA family dithiol-disulfide isomerase